MRKAENRDILFTLFSFAVLVTTGEISKNTWDYGDSIAHYIYSHFAFQAPVLFLNLWAKPLSVILSSPFAYFGFGGMKVFQALANSLTIFFTIKTCRKLQFRFPLLAGVFLLSMPKFVLSTSSGLTEPLFAMWLIASVYFMVNNQKAFATILFSFLLFVRQEGMVVDVIVAAYLLFSGNWKHIFLLFTALIVFGLVGLPHYHHFLWYFINNPYNHPPGFHGYGDGFAFVNMYLFFTGDALAIFSLSGLVIASVLFFRKKSSKSTSHFSRKQFFLLAGFLVGFIAFHAIACQYGLFGSSCGLTRVFLCILPLASIFALEAFEFIVTAIGRYSKRIARAISIFLLLIIIVFPFSQVTTAYSFPKDFQPDKDLLLMNSVAAWIKENNITGEIYYSAPYINLALPQVNAFNVSSQDLIIFLDPESLGPGSLYIWDSWFSVTERTRSLEDLTKNNDFMILRKFYLPGKNDPDLVILRKN